MRRWGARGRAVPVGLAEFVVPTLCEYYYVAVYKCIILFGNRGREQRYNIITRNMSPSSTTGKDPEKRSAKHLQDLRGEVLPTIFLQRDTYIISQCDRVPWPGGWAPGAWTFVVCSYPSYRNSLYKLFYNCIYITQTTRYVFGYIIFCNFYNVFLKRLFCVCM